MGENSAISWTDHTFNPWIGCTRVSPACDGCYAAALMGGEANRFHRADWGGPGKGEGTRDRTKDWSAPLQWNRKAAVAPGRTFVFCASLADVFDNHPDVAPWRRQLFDLIRATPNLTWLLLTKRPGNILSLFRESQGWDPDLAGLESDVWPRNAAIGCTVVTQAESNRDIPKLLAAKAALNPAFAFVSMEPLLEAVELTCLRLADGGFADVLNGLTRAANSKGLLDIGVGQRLDWVITGGETDQADHQARPQHPAWFRSLRDQCTAAGVPFHHKQNGEWAPVSDIQTGDEVFIGDKAQSMRKLGKRAAGRLIDGATHDDRPEIRR